MKGKNLYCFQKKEHGDYIVDELGSILIMIFCFVLVLLFACYSRAVQMRLAIDNIGKTYLYQMEQYGYLSDDMKNNMTEDLRLIGVEVTANGFAGSTSGTQVSYGEKVILKCQVTFQNPLREMLSSEEHDSMFFTIANLSEKIAYTIDMTATAKW